MLNDRLIEITVGKGRRDTNWIVQKMLVSDLWDRLGRPIIGTEGLKDYLSLPKGQQDDLKDVGGYVAGRIAGGRRKGTGVETREIVTLDLDNLGRGTENALSRIEGLGCGYCAHSSRKHHPGAGRLRLLIPMDRAVSSEEYEPIARRVGEWIGLDLCDSTTFEAVRMMFWPSVCSDVEYVYRIKDAAFLSADGVLATYQDWRDVREWPNGIGASVMRRSAVKQGEPTEKKGLVGAFCRAYDISRVMEELLEGVYTQNTEDRYTYSGGSTVGGAVVYDGKFLYSHHATDPCSGRLVNAYDLVRLHKFGDLDEEADPQCPTSNLPSSKAMREFCGSLEDVKREIAEKKFEELDFSKFDSALGNTEVAVGEKREMDDWFAGLGLNERGEIESTIDNILKIMEGDERLKGVFALNEMAGRGELLKRAPWSTRAFRRRLWEDGDSNGLMWYLENMYGIRNERSMNAALSIHAERHAFNDVRDYLDSLEWDGIERVETLYRDYLGADGTSFVRNITRKGLAAAVARVYKPGIKFDCMTTFVGPQGIGKSTMIAKLSKGWFTDALSNLYGKEPCEIIQGKWLVEVPELQALEGAAVTRVKQFLSTSEDRYRAAYGHFVQEVPRSCVFFGSVNPSAFLKDDTGNRRFWVVECSGRAAKSVWRDLDEEVDQIWAEARLMWMSGEELFLQKDMERESENVQKKFQDDGIYSDEIYNFIEVKIPIDWYSMESGEPVWPEWKKKQYWDGSIKYDGELVQRDRICAKEVWVEKMHGRSDQYDRRRAGEINATLKRLGELQTIHFGCHGNQKGVKLL